VPGYAISTATEAFLSIAEAGFARSLQAAIAL
jgi:hypothetical protein